MFADIRQTRGTEHGVNNRVQDHITVGVPAETELEVYLDASQSQAAVGDKLVEVITDADT